jgi:N-acetylglucosaminyl-diphospho-decaprenol L-rhamnosyltransferase
VRSDALAVVVVAHHSAADLPDTLLCVRAQLRPDDELIVVDCASRDGSAAAARAAAPDAQVVALEHNAGFAGGARVGAEASTAPLLFFLNPDAVPALGCVAALRRAAAEHPGWGAWQSLVVHSDGRTVNSAGNEVHWLGFGWAGGCDEPVAAIDPAPRGVSFASGAALMVRREVWEAVGGFAPEYFMYGEDLDLGLRLRLAGWESGIVPAARVAHDYTFEKGDFKWYYLERNRWWTVLATYPGALLVLLAPALLAFEFALLVVAARDGWLAPKLRAQCAVLASLRWALSRRRRVQRLGRVRAGHFAEGLTASLDSPYLNAPTPLVTLQARYWRLVRAALSRRYD